MEPFTGSVTFSDPLSLEQEAAIERANFHLGRALENIDGAEDGAAIRTLTILPGILECVEKWNLSKIPEEPTVQTWPTRPRNAVVSLVSWLFTEIGKIYTDSQDEEIPNAPAPQPTPTPAATDLSQENSTSSSVSTVSVSKPS
jgi:hypothetical protein